VSASPIDTWQAILSRRNVRTFTDTPIPADDLDRVLEAARRTPSSRNLQRWDLVVCTERDQLERLSTVWQGAGHVATAAAAIAILAPKSDDRSTRESTQYDLGQLTMMVLLAATGLGIGSAHAAVGDQAKARDVLGYPDDRFCAWLISLGYPGDRPLAPIQKPDRRPFDEVVHRERW
jgi:nitroreductase